MIYLRRLRVSTYCLVALCAVSVFTSTAGRGIYAANSGPTWDRISAAQYLDRRAQWWQTWSGAARGQGTACISCHTSLPIALARPALSRQIGDSAPVPAEQSIVDGVVTRVDNWDAIVTSSDWSKCTAYYTDQKPAALGTEAVLDALVLVDHDVERSRGVLSASTDSSLSHLWQQQQPDGSWKWIEFGLCPWEGNSVYYGTALAAVTVGMAGRRYYDRPDIISYVDAMRNYLSTHYAASRLHDKVVCLWASTYLPGILTADQQQALVYQLFSIQQADGGWSLPKLGRQPDNPQGWGSGGTYPVGSVSDGFATGLVVLALKRVGVQGSEPHLERAIDWLSANENTGSWPANYINGSRDPLSDVGGFMRDAATSFAVLGLTEPFRR